MNKYQEALDRVKESNTDKIKSNDLEVKIREEWSNEIDLLQELVERFSSLPDKEKIKSSLDMLWASSDDRYCEIVEEEHKKISLFLNVIYGDE